MVEVSWVECYPLEGDCPVLIYLPGLDCTGELLYLHTKNLSRFFSIYCLKITTDSRSGWQELTEKVIDLMASLGEDKSIYLLAESFGGCLALQIATSMGSVLKGLVLVNPASCFRQTPWWGWGIYITDYVPYPVFQAATIGFLPLLAATHRMKGKDCQRLLMAIRSVPPKTLAWRLSLLWNFDLPKGRYHLPPKVLLISSVADLLLPSFRESQRLKKVFPHARTIVLPTSGHAALLESDIDLVKLLRKGEIL